MLRVFIRSKIQRLTVTDKNLMYEGSLQIDRSLMDAAHVLPGEMVQVVNVSNGQRFETYLIAAPSGSGDCVLNGGAARLGENGDQLIVMSTALLSPSEVSRHRPVVVRVDSHNRIISDRNRPRGR